MPKSIARQLRTTARRTFGWESLRAEQTAAMTAVMEGRDTLVVMPTGAGKSAVYQVPGVLLDGPTVVVSPLIALQRDQVEGLLGLDGPAAAAVNSTQRAAENRAAWDRVTTGDIDFLFLAPEQLARDEVVDQLAEAKPALVVVDEAQCVSSWGHDFRPDYLRIRHALGRIGRPPVLALTANAAAPVRADIVEQLGMADVHEVVAGFDRPNISLEVTTFQDEEVKRRAVVERAAAEAKPGIVYAATRRDAEAYAADLAELGLDSAPYHAGMRAADRTDVHDRFRDGSLDVVVATSAFGMGIDKADIRFVLHASVPGSLDAFYQEMGRAGRDGEPARAILAYRPQDLGLQRFLSSGRPDPDTLVQVLRLLRRRRKPVSLTELREESGLSASRLTAVVNLLEHSDAVRTNEDGTAEAVPRVKEEEVVRDAMRLGDSRQQLEQSRVEMMRGFAETTSCRRQFLLGYFGERPDEPCGNCDVCASAELRLDGADEHGDTVLAGTGSAPAAPAAAPDHPFAPGTRVTHAAWGEGETMSEEDGKLTVLFDSVGYRTLSVAAVVKGDILKPASEDAAA
ncbi:RecQ family ATP-dependent DNA helicase [Streptomyces sp. NPDC060194]|uniref:RecQ family ATP-dependent DNA helicase n=1 Tax=Streptomyces sp. NPDC060194 TaxID=3347069 RepID=UPI0036684531